MRSRNSMLLGRHSMARQRGAGHGRGQRLRAAHAAQPGGQDPAAGQAALIVLARHLDEGLVGALHDALAADVDPRARGHLAEHHQALAVELVEMLPGRPVRHQVGVGDQDARRVGVGAEDADRLARLHQKRLVGLEIAQRGDDAVEALPVARRAADAAIDHELARPLGDLGIEVVHQHAQRRLGQPALGRAFGAARRADGAGVVEARGHVGLRVERRQDVGADRVDRGRRGRPGRRRRARSGWKWRSSSRCGTCRRTSARTASSIGLERSG